ncbi:hypothetical protein COMNV_00911 [Commensalibacter sp. Nvir]|uniref:DNA recombination protein RmuC n=1 Tax=Commensalibacter sp. Nvir TaxID=3069817 RepID=UPI002D463364|nr:hypothetical protein COMNV_00911 [Commensalibacter sp. Nvir]
MIDLVLIASNLFLLGVVVVLFILKQSSSNPIKKDELLEKISFSLEKELSQRLAYQESQQRRFETIERTLSEKLYSMNNDLIKEQSALKLEQVKAMQNLSEENSKNLMQLRQTVSERLHYAVEEQMQSSFQRVLEQFSQIQKMVGEVSSITVQIGDLKRLFSNVKTRGGWAEAQLRSILDDILPTGAFETNVYLREGSKEVVEFAVYMPAQGKIRPLLAIDAKFPTESYEKMIQAMEQGDNQAEQNARRALESTVKQEAKKIASKYILPPQTVDFAILYVPTDGLYTEIARIPGLIDEIGRIHQVLVMSPALMPPLLKTIHLGYVSLALGEKTEFISKLLGKTRQEVARIDSVFEKLLRNTEAMTCTISEAKRKTQKLTQSLQEIGNVEVDS